MDDICLYVIHAWRADDPWFQPVNEAVREAHRRVMENIKRLVRIANRCGIPVMFHNAGRPTDPELEALIRWSRRPAGPCRVALYTGFAADFSLGTMPDMGYFESNVPDKRIVWDATLALHVWARDARMHAQLSGRWADWYKVRKARPYSESLPWTSADDLITETKKFCQAFCPCPATDTESVIVEMEEKGSDVRNSLTLVTVPLPFDGPKGLAQRNALGSWLLLNPRPEIIFIDEKGGLDDIARRVGARIVGGVERTEYGMSMRSIFRLIDEHATHDLIAYVDLDVILGQSFMTAIQYCAAQYDEFLMGGGRWSAKGMKAVNFADPVWQSKVWSRVFKNHHKGSDYAVYRRGTFENMPDFTIGLGAWDGWRMGEILRRGSDLINSQRVVYAVHQDHALRKAGSPGWNRNRQLTGGCQAWVTDATHYLGGADIGLPKLRIGHF